MKSAACHLVLASTCALTLALPISAGAAPASGAVYVMTNQPGENAVMVYARGADGSLSYQASYATGGTGAGSGADALGSQGALSLQGALLFAANAGSNDISMFAARDGRLELLDRVPSGGTMPVSITAHGNTVYALNAGATPNISGFRIDELGRHLVPLPGSQRALAGGTAASPAEVHFAADGQLLLVTEKGTQTIDSYSVDALGYTEGPSATPASAATPFGFAVTRRGFAIISEAGAGAVSSYDLAAGATPTLVSGPIALGQSAPCWLVTTPDGRFAFTANAGSGSISLLAIAPDGSLTLANAAAAQLAAPLDMALSDDGHFLYAREGNGSLTGYQVHADGSLAYVTTMTGIPSGAQGVAAH